MNYVPKSPKKIKTNRYLFHVSHPMSREGIQHYGLLMSKFEETSRNGVYAHNLITEPDFNWWPFLEFGLADDGPIEKNPLKYYDYWRIDTQLISTDCFIDEWARHDFMSIFHFDPRDMYIYTNGDIPVRALQLFRFQNDQFWEFNGTQGAYHYRSTGNFRPYIE
jgi:hypothetical protein